MIKPEKLSINFYKVMKNEELVNLRGGYATNNCCLCIDANGYSLGYIVGTTYDQCGIDCGKRYPGKAKEAYWYCY